MPVEEPNSPYPKDSVKMHPPDPAREKKLTATCFRLASGRSYATWN